MTAKRYEDCCESMKTPSELSGRVERSPYKALFMVTIDPANYHDLSKSRRVVKTDWRCLSIGYVLCQRLKRVYVVLYAEPRHISSMLIKYTLIADQQVDFSVYVKRNNDAIPPVNAGEGHLSVALGRDVLSGNRMLPDFFYHPADMRC